MTAQAEKHIKCSGLIKPLTPQHPYMNCDNLAQDVIPLSACIVAQARRFKPCRTCEYGGAKNAR